LAIGVVAVTSNKMSLEFAFGRAWRDWPGSHNFSKVRAGLERNDILYMLRRSERRRGPVLAAWANAGASWEPYLVGQWELEEAADLLARFEPSTPWSDWINLAEAFLAGLKPDEVRRR
jgi:hypothetical protein